MECLDKLKEKIKKVTKTDEEFTISLKNFSEYCKSHSLLIVLTILILFLAHGGNIFYNNLGIDTQMFIEDPTFEYNWLGIGRFGLLIERIVLGLTKYSPYYAGILFFLFLVLSNIVLFYTIYKVSNKDLGFINLCIPAISLTSPIFVEQFVYMLQYAEIASAIFLTALSTLFIFTWIKNNKIVYMFLGIAGLIISFASYQSFVGLYIAFCIFTFIMMFENEDSNHQNSLKTIIKLILTFVFSIIAYKIITKILPSNTAYIDDSFFWGNRPLREIYEFIKGHILEVLKGKGNYYNLGYSIGVILCLIIAIYKIFKEKSIQKTSNKIWYVLSMLAFMATPFYMVLAIGHAPLLRAQLILPYTESFLIMYATYYLFKNKWFKYLALVVIVYVFEVQMYMTETLYYTDKLRNESDIQIANEIIHDIGELGIKENNVLAIIGHRDAKLNNACITGETVGLSLFTMNYAVMPYYFNSSSIIIRLFNCLGYNYVLATPDQIQEARKEAQNMPVWPEKGSIKSYNNYIIVKISDDELPLE